MSDCVIVPVEREGYNCKNYDLQNHGHLCWLQANMIRLLSVHTPGSKNACCCITLMYPLFPPIFWMNNAHVTSSDLLSGTLVNACLYNYQMHMYEVVRWRAVRRHTTGGNSLYQCSHSDSRSL